MSIAKPYTFSAGTKARSNEVNENFDVVYSQVNADMSRIDAIEFDITELEGSKADINGNPSQRFQVANAINDNDAINKQTMKNLSYNTRDYINGLVITRDNNNTIIVSAGSCYSSDYETMMVLASNTSKQNSSQGANTTYYVHLISNSSGTSSDILISATKINPPLPSSYTKYRNIGNYTTNGNGVIDLITSSSNSVTLEDSLRKVYPDYNNVVGIGLPYTCPNKGWVYCRSYLGDNTRHIYVNGIEVMGQAGSQYGGIPSRGSTIFMVNKGDIVTQDGGFEYGWFKSTN